VVLLGGSGPTDRDGTIGPNKVLKDLAWGLATRRIAVARFDKVTLARGEKASRNANFTLADEYVPAALAAIDELRQDPGVDPEQVFVAGHSLGGTAAPLVAAADPLVAGLVILAGGAEPLHRTIVRQVRYLASLNPATAATAEPALAVLERQADLIDSDDLSPATPAADLPLGVPAPYWIHLRGYDPVALAGSLGRPILVVQGGRDYQSTVTEDLAHWQAGLADQPGVTVHVYPDDNHLFLAGSGPSTPAEYDAPQHVDPEVVAGVAEWIATAKAGGPMGPTA
jgi:dienelactone hydrolase